MRLSHLPKKRLAYIALFTATIIWGAATPVIKLTMQSIPAFTFLFLRFLIIGIIILPFILLELRKDPVNKKDIPNLILLGLMGQTGLAIVFLGLKYASALDAAFIGITYPIIAIAAGHYFFKEKVNKFVQAGVLISTFGTILIILEPALKSSYINSYNEHRIIGNLLVLLYQFTWLSYIVWSKEVMGESSKTLTRTIKLFHLKPMVKDYHPMLLIALTFYVGLASFIPLALLENLGVFGYTVNLINLPFSAIIGVLYMSIFSSIVAYCLFQWGLHNAQISDTALFTYLGPLVTFPFAYLLLGEIPTKETLLGGSIIALGVIIAEKFKS